jgi:hypothetical protein
MEHVSNDARSSVRYGGSNRLHASQTNCQNPCSSAPGIQFTFLAGKIPISSRTRGNMHPLCSTILPALQETDIHRWESVQVTADMREDLTWRNRILGSHLLNGVPLQYFHSHPPADIVIEMDASDTGLCAVDRATSARFCMCYRRLKDSHRRLPLRQHQRVRFKLSG